MIPTKKVVILGGGCAGLSAAHELVKLNRLADAGRAPVRFEIHVYEKADSLGGKLQSQFDDAPGGGKWPGEHGFRFFPQFYQHLTATLREIPHPKPGKPDASVWDWLVAATAGGIASGKLTIIPRKWSTSSVEDAVRGVLGATTERIAPEDLAFYTLRVATFLSSCPERRLAEYDHRSWEDFLRMDRLPYSTEGRRLLLSVPAVLSAMRAHDSSARTVGNTSAQVMFNFHPLTEQDPIDGILEGPTTEAWLVPWEAALRGAGVNFHLGRAASAFDILPGPSRRLARVQVRDAGGAEEWVDADWFILAVPVEVALKFQAAGVLPDTELDQLARVARPVGVPAWERWTGHMVGAQFFLAEDRAICKGHVAYPLSPWALTSLSQPQFWRNGVAAYGVAGLKGVLSVIISEWDVASPRTHKTAREHLRTGDRVGLLEEVWRQIQDGLGPGNALPDALVLHSRLDPNVQGGGGTFENSSPLLIHPVGGYLLRPLAESAVRGLLFAGDYLRTSVDLATMEGANEGARMAVRAIFAREGVAEKDWPFHRTLDEGPAFAAIQLLDKELFRRGLPPILECRVRDILAVWQGPLPTPGSLVATGRTLLRAAYIAGSVQRHLANGVTTTAVNAVLKLLPG